MKKWTILLLTVLLLAGCTRIDQTQPDRPRVVTRIQASYHSDTIKLQRTYTDAEKMQAVLTYLRCLDVSGPAESPPADGEMPQGHVRLYYSDDTYKDYYQRSDRYLQINGGPWQNISLDRGREFPILLGLMESDQP